MASYCLSQSEYLSRCLSRSNTFSETDTLIGRVTDIILCAMLMPWPTTLGRLLMSRTTLSTFSEMPMRTLRSLLTIAFGSIDLIDGAQNFDGEASIKVVGFQRIDQCDADTVAGR